MCIFFLVLSLFAFLYASKKYIDCEIWEMKTMIAKRSLNTRKRLDYFESIIRPSRGQGIEALIPPDISPVDR